MFNYGITECIDCKRIISEPTDYESKSLCQGCGKYRNNRDYYKSELDKLNLNSAYPLSVKFFDGEGNNTKQLNLTIESIDEIKKLFNRILK